MRYNFSDGWFVGSEGGRSGLGMNGISLDGAFGTRGLSYEGVQFGYNFQNARNVPFQVFGGFNTLKCRRPRRQPVLLLRLHVQQCGWLHRACGGRIPADIESQPVAWGRLHPTVPATSILSRCPALLRPALAVAAGVARLIPIRPSQWRSWPWQSIFPAPETGCVTRSNFTNAVAGRRHHAARHRAARDHRDPHRQQDRRDPQDPADARQGWRRLRPRRVAGRGADAPVWVHNLRAKPAVEIRDGRW